MMQKWTKHRIRNWKTNLNKLLKNSALRTTLLLAALCLVCLIGFLPLAIKLSPLMYFDGAGQFRISDFAHYHTICRAFWTGENNRLYQASSQLPVLSHAAGGPVSGAMPLAILPTALLIWFPFLIIPSALITWAYAAWIATSLTVLLPQIKNLVKFTAARSPGAARLSVVLLVFFLSSTFTTTVALGQTSLFALGLLLALIFKLTSEEESSASHSSGIFVPGLASLAVDCAILFLLSIKLHYLIAAVVLLVSFRRIRSIAIGGALIGSTIGLLTLRLGLGWIEDYRQSLSIFFSETPPAWIASAFAREKMVIFLSAFGPFTGRNAALGIAQASYGICAIISALIIFTIVRSDSRSKLARTGPFIIMVSAYLLFTPYMGHYEDLLLLAPLAAAATSAPKRLFAPIKTIVLAFALFFVLNHDIMQSTVPLWPFWCIKLLYLGLILITVFRPSSGYVTPKQVPANA
jgi:hypothetical protein